MGIKDRLTVYLGKQGLVPEDIPKVIGCFVAGKYITWFTMIGICMRYQPLRRTWHYFYPELVARSGVWRERQRGRFVEHRTRMFSWANERYEPLASRINIQRGVNRGPRKWANGHHSHYGRNSQSAGGGSTNEQQNGGRAYHRETPSFFKRCSMSMYNLMEKAAARVGDNKAWGFISTRILHVNSRAFAFAVGESLILFKLTFIFHAPLVLFTVVRTFQWWRGVTPPPLFAESPLKTVSKWATDLNDLMQASIEELDPLDSPSDAPSPIDSSSSSAVAVKATDTPQTCDDLD
ncbi:hypothetical protein FOL47_000293 [Perkinsus chesapeaki]|uniref:Uncharacterized protein n=1 Tax=Perkinsus chesapeaki TaxID=330153 RepID=A0A7J6KXF6_PERCH|nr:hypothetical protein FOL47_000293 [Perkinsus chesapeaki]